ncbi:MAG: sugar phosphate nucleotidyltransferase [Candidatus Omnitrophica bacterium]|nr:sugar phosphate nucleotidyltransferase [Candidatus Omnitrophota bacterium]
MVNKKIRPADLPVVILCGGKGTRMGPEDAPKPMFPIGGKPILWHIMKYFSCFGCKRFILLVGYRKEKIINHFSKLKDWEIDFIDTGLETNTGGRIKLAEKTIQSGIFFVTYGDGLSNVNLKKLLEYHLKHKKTATLTAARPCSPFGIIGVETHTGAVTHFEEKPILDHWVNGGFFVFDKRVFRWIKKNSVLEKDVLPVLARRKKLNAYKHTGFWECMDTYKDNLRLNNLWDNTEAPWAIWRKER